MKAYKKTSVNWSRSQSAIIKLLNSKGIFESRFTNLEEKFALEFKAIDPETSKPIAIRIVVPLEKTTSEDARQRELNSLHRVLFFHLKAKFIAIDSGLTEFMEEFMHNLVIMDKNGNSTTMGQVLLPQYKQGIESGEQKDFKLLG